jgi:hypothetical protein
MNVRTLPEPEDDEDLTLLDVVKEAIAASEARSAAALAAAVEELRTEFAQALALAQKDMEIATLRAALALASPGAASPAPAPPLRTVGGR